MSGKDKTKGSLALAAPRVITIPANNPEISQKLRVAAYARVSSNSDDQAHSFAAQNAYFSKLIAGNPNWELADIYADKGITGTSIDKREDFLRMMDDCRKGRVDRILVKSISRFGRNTKESLEAVRELAGLGVSVLFEEQKIDTAESTGEMLTAIFATLAQKESESISEKMRWSIRTRMTQGRYLTPSIPFGYRKGESGELVIDEIKAKYVRDIFDTFLAGKNSGEIAAQLKFQQRAAPELADYRWTYKAVVRILRNEKYIGDSLWQKTFQTDDLPRHKKDNKGQKPQYYVAESHPAVIEREKFEKVQKLLQSRKGKFYDTQDERSPFHRMIRCGCCGANCRRKRVHGIAYQVCRTHTNNKDLCPSRQLQERFIQDAFLRLYFKLKRHGEGILTQLITDLRTARNESLLWSEGVVELNKQITDIAGQERLLLLLKQQGAVSPDLFLSRSDQLAEQRRTAKLKKERLLRSEEDHTIQRTQDLLDYLRSGPDTLSFFDEALFSELVDKIIVTGNKTLRFRLINGLELTESIERTKR